MPLRSPSNQQLEQSTIFIRSRFEQEEHIYLHDEDTHATTGHLYPIDIQNNNNTVLIINNNQEAELAYQFYKNQVI